MIRDKVDDLMRDAVAQLQNLAKDQGFKRLPDEKTFMDELSGEDDSPRIIVRRRFTTLSWQRPASGGAGCPRARRCAAAMMLRHAAKRSASSCPRITRTRTGPTVRAGLRFAMTTSALSHSAFSRGSYDLRLPP